MNGKHIFSCCMWIYLEVGFAILILLMSHSMGCRSRDLALYLTYLYSVTFIHFYFIGNLQIFTYCFSFLKEWLKFSYFIRLNCIFDCFYQHGRLTVGYESAECQAKHLHDGIKYTLTYVSACLDGDLRCLVSRVVSYH